MAATMVTRTAAAAANMSPFASPPTDAPAQLGLTPKTAANTQSPTTTQRPAKQRDGFLDALRAVAIIRVVLWHAFGTPIISWVIATMPMMFFVAGSLLHNSLEARPAGQVLRSRLRRLLVPFWFFGAIVLGFLSTSATLGRRPTSRPTNSSAGSSRWSTRPLLVGKLDGHRARSGTSGHTSGSSSCRRCCSPPGADSAWPSFPPHWS
jgi:hypothetical protein